jgi:hypothetical protein
MLAVLPRFSDFDIDRTIAKLANRAKHRDETVLGIWKIWMPYHRIRILCQNVDSSTPQTALTALNAVLCGYATTELELLQLFRPKHLENPLKKIDPKAEEITCAHPVVDLDDVLGRLFRLRAQAREKLGQAEGQLVRDYRNMQLRYLLLPMSTKSLEREKQVSSKLAELQSTLLAINICLNLEDRLLPQKIEADDVIYFPMAVVQLKQKDDLGRYALIDLTTGKQDSALTRLCEMNSNFKSGLELALGSST